MKYIFKWLIALLITTTNMVVGQDNGIWLYENQGQWHPNILYQTGLVNGVVYLEKKGFTYAFHSANQLHAHKQESAHTHDESIEGYAIKSYFVGSEEPNSITASDFSAHYMNYFLGNNPDKWKSFVRGAKEVKMLNIYPGISFVVDTKSDSYKYSFIVNPGVSPSVIKQNIDGALALWIDEERNFHMKHPFGEIIESAPVAWTISSQGEKTPVMVHFKLVGTQLSYEFPQAYNTNELLVIDPTLTFSTFTGATADNWGFTATPDASANVFAAGIVFAAGYPTTAGVYDPIYNGGSFDIGLSKFNATGNLLMYSTYIGGSQVETPHSIISNAAGDLFMMGVTSSSNFPTTQNTYQSNFKGGPSFTENGLGFTQGADLFVLRLNAAGSVLLGSTLIGGNGTDGINRGTLNFNYGDQFRGDITLDNQGNPFVVSSTTSNNFPMVNPIHGTLTGNQSAVIFKFNPLLTNLLWSTYFGGNGFETGNSIQVADDQTIYIAGGTTSSNLPFQLGVSTSYLGGISDGYVAHINPTTSQLLSGTYIGTSEYDQAFFVQLDLDQKVYILGQNEGDLAISPGKYGNPSAGQFIRKYNASLSSIEWTTTIGSQTGHVAISPTAFLVSDCYDIYFSGWGGEVNRNNSSAVNSSSSNFPITSDAFQSVTAGNNFYIGVLGPNAQNLKYGTYMGGVSGSSNHVDGGTSRFDKSGRIYHAVCAACQGNNFGFTSTPGVYAPQNPSPNCNMAAFKFELNQIEALVNIPNTTFCFPGTVNFINNSSNGNAFHWDFGDNTSSTSVNPSHTYAAPGNYTITLTVSDTNNCFSSDTTMIPIEIIGLNAQLVAPPAGICPGDTYQFQASGGTTYSWSPANVLNNATIANPIATINETTVFNVVISNECGSDTLAVTLNVYGTNSTIISDTNICIGDSVVLFATGGTSYQWSPSTYLTNSQVGNPLCVPANSIDYTVEITTIEGCTMTKQVHVEVSKTPPSPLIDDTVHLCLGTSLNLNVSGASSYQWVNSSGISPLSGPSVTINTLESKTYYCNFINACAEILDSVYVKVVQADVQAFNDTIICFGQSVELSAIGALSYSWDPTTTLNSASGATVIATPTVSTQYQVTGTDSLGCVATDLVWVTLFPKPTIQANSDSYAYLGDEVSLGIQWASDGIIYWEPTEYLSCVTCVSPIATPNQEYTYTVYVLDTNGCKASDALTIYYDPTIYVPNTFTPNNDDNNQVFKVVAGNISNFKLYIFNRWGELIHTFHSVDDYWDGTYKGLNCQDGTYVWKAFYSNLEDTKRYEISGHINLLR